jgi:hypothetical protein
MSRRMIVALLAVGLTCGIVVAKDTAVTLDKTDTSPEVVKQEAVIEATPILAKSVGGVVEAETRQEEVGESGPTGNQVPYKGTVVEPDPRVQQENANSSRVEGDTCGEAYVVTELPYNTLATTVDNTDTWGRSNADEWYLFTAIEATDYRISLCGDGSTFDTYLYLLEDDCATIITYNDDECGLQSELEWYLEPGDYIVCVEGYSTTGPYELDILALVPCVVECPDGASIDPEPNCYDEYVDVTNGGCDSPLPVFGSIACGETICGTAGTYTVGGIDHRDTDWYLFDLLEPSTVTWSVEAEFDPYIKLIETNNCVSPVTIAYAYGNECEMTTVETVLYPGQYAAYVTPDAFTGVPCDADFWATLTCEPWSPPVGASCESPIEVTIPADLPYSDLAQTTCGMLDDYDETDLDYYDGGEDTIYELIVTEPVTFDISMDPGPTTYSALAIFDGCPDIGTLLHSVTGYAAAPRELEGIALTAGTYYIMVDTWPSPDCIPSFDLVIEDAFCDIVCPPEGIDEGEEICSDEYIDVTNSGCDAALPVFGTINCGETICGTSGTFLVGGVETRDTDWFLFDLAETSEVVWTGEAEFEVLLALVSGVPGCDPETVIASATDTPCDIVTVTTILEAGTYAAYAAPANFNGVICGSEYYATLTCTPWSPPLGDYCINPYMVTELPYTYVGTTEDNTDTFGNLAPDEWHRFTLINPALVTIELCGPETDYDTYLRLVGDDCITQIAYDDDGPTCDEDTAPYEPSEVSLELEPGVYNVCVDGYSSNFGNYHLDIIVDEPCVVECPPEGVDEGEVICYDEYVDATNGGCNSDPYVFGAIANGETICGTSGTYTVGGVNTRDTDWFLFDIAETSEVTVTCEAEFPLYLTIASGVPECPSTNEAYYYGEPCEFVTIVSLLDAGTYAVFVAPDAYSGIACGKPYYVTLNHSPWSPPVGDTCADPLIAPCLPYQFFSTTGNNTDTYGNASPDEWTRFTLADAASLSISLCGEGTNFDTYLRLMDEDCITELAYNDDYCGLQSQIDVDLDAGTYVICVEGYSSASGEYQLDITGPIPALSVSYSSGSAVLLITGDDAGYFNIYKSSVPYEDPDIPGDEFVLVATIPNTPGPDTWMDPATGSFFYKVTGDCSIPE